MCRNRGGKPFQVPFKRRGLRSPDVSLVYCCCARSESLAAHNARIFLLGSGGSLAIIGESTEVRQALREIGLPCRIEMAISPAIEEFICGKKNGKINKVAKESQCAVFIRKEEELYLVIQGSPRNAEFSLSMVEDELPAEYSFYLHEKYHKKIIGYGGKTIQRLMKKNGVYIKFESKASAAHNVVIRTPRKNKDSLQKMYKDVMELAGEPPVMVQGAWSSLAYCDFYAIRFDVFRLRMNEVEVFAKEHVEVQYYLVSQEKIEEIRGRKRIEEICKIDNMIVVASLDLVKGGKPVTLKTWKKQEAASTYFSREYGDALFSEEGIWNKKWRISFLDTWQGSSWRSRGFSRM